MMIKKKYFIFYDDDVIKFYFYDFINYEIIFL